MFENTEQQRSADRLAPGLLMALFAVLLFFAATGVINYLNTRSIKVNVLNVTSTHEVLSALSDVLSLIKDAETGQRGFLLTGDEEYLEPYNKSLARIDERLKAIELAGITDSFRKERLGVLRGFLTTKLEELEETVLVRRTEGFEAALARLRTGRGRLAMDAIRTELAQLQQLERTRRNERLEEMNQAYQVAVGSGILTCVLGVLLGAAVSYMVYRESKLRRHQEWIQTGQVLLSNVLVGEQRLEELGEKVLRFVTEYTKAPVAAFYAHDGSAFRRVATLGVPADFKIRDKFGLNDGLLGKVVQEKKLLLVDNIPEGYLAFGSSLGFSPPRHLLLFPTIHDRGVNGVLELGYLESVDDRTKEWMQSVGDSIGTAIQSANYRTSLQNFLEETQRQSEELQAQSEELRVSNEELEEQSRSLKESQGRLEQQQAELEQTNVQLVEQAKLLEVERDTLAQTKNALQLQSAELTQASKYKSDFLANMSHELRTPLNSSLILAKLLADNPAGNLSEEQVRYALTIQSAGNDLLALINDILDLSKIEAGQMDVVIEKISPAEIAQALSRIFEPLAADKKIELVVSISDNCPDFIETDRQRLEQVLKNLLSNAVKFTETGSVKLMVSRAEGDRISFAVSDTGIGIPEHQQEMIFEAFRQADGNTNRKYGGTGLGLSISRQLAALLGGAISLSSEAQKGSVFTVTIPFVYSASSDENMQVVQKMTSSSSDSALLKEKALLRKKNPESAPKVRHRFQDDRERLSGAMRVILVVEDDLPFARILYDLIHEAEFQCLLAETAEEACVLAMQYLPSAVILDIGLPDHSGLSVLDRLKNDSRTRHIPVHVITAGDHAQTSLTLGAVGYMPKPVKREDLVQALKKLETTLSQRMRRVLVVEDDPVQLDSLQKLLRSQDVDTQGAASAADCLEALKNKTFDCMVLDLSLPDTSGYVLLETLSKEDAYSFPPVIVYTGRSLSAQEEERLRKYSKSIIIKGAKSPERLLDEVTLFLHQVVSELPVEKQRMLQQSKSRDAVLEGRRILIVEDDVRNIFALTSILESRGAILDIARNGREALAVLEKSQADPALQISLVLMDVMMPEMDGMTATREIRKRPEFKKLPVIMLTAKAMKDDQERCLEAGANDYMAKPLDVEKLLSLVRVWMPR